MNPVAIQEVADADTISQICRFRVSVWRATGALASSAFPDEQWRDAADDHATHWVARRSDGAMVGAARLAIYHRLDELQESGEYIRHGLSFDGSIAAPDRVVVSAEAAGQGVGGALVDQQEDAWQRTSAVAAVRQASPRMCQLIAKRGWELVGPAKRDTRFPGVDFMVAVKRRKWHGSNLGANQ